ncbi:hypothetical protein ABI59_23090 [Acidobacteria bacterium Mor1]|nr:hypothetical protein ABI59_23090 [Acidobacteria bacterium Mor1]
MVRLDLELRDQLAEAIQLEVVSEQASALGRISGQLEGLLERLETLREEVAAATPTQRAGRVRLFNATRDEAARWFWYLEVQREVLGFTDREALLEAYPVPDPIR